MASHLPLEIRFGLSERFVRQLRMQRRNRNQKTLGVTHILTQQPNKAQKWASG